MKSSESAETDSDGQSGADRRAEVRYDGPGTPPPSVAVVEVVADVRDCEPTDLEPLHTVVDPDALDALAAGRRGGGPWVEFEYAGVPVEVGLGGDVVAASDR